MSSTPRSPSSPSHGRASSVAGGSTSGGSSRGAFGLPSTSAMQAYAVDALLTSTLGAITTAPPRLPVAKNKEPLALSTVAINMRAFTQKSGPIFYFQDAVEATLVWDDWAWTSMWMAIWAVVALHPYLLLCAPTAILAIILIRTHRARFPVGVPLPPGAPATAAGPAGLATPSPAQSVAHALAKPASTGQGAVMPPLVPNPPHEGEIRYYENLRDIQNMMKMVTDGYDLIAPSVQYLNWSSYPRTLLLFQASLVLTATMFMLGPYLPIRPILLVAGEGAFLAGHPWVAPAISGLKKSIAEERKNNPRGLPNREMERWEKRSREMRNRAQQWMDEDRLDDEVWERGWRDVEMFENERFVNPTSASSAAVPGWSAHNLTFGERKPFTKGADGWSAEALEVTGFALDIRQVAMALEPGWAWVDGDDWRIDWIGEWSPIGVDEEGFVYTDRDWLKPAPYAYGHSGHRSHPPRSRIADASATDSDDGSSDDGTIDVELDEENRVPVLKAETRRRRWLRRAVQIKQ